ncbi:MAG: 5'-3' exonuclease [Egibacteraceae bacterium]
MDTLSLFDADLRPVAVAVAKPAVPAAPATRERPRPPRPSRPMVLAVDGNSLAHRAFHAYPRPEALRGFCALLAAIADRVGADGTLVGFDCPQRSVRRERWPAYKAQRPPKDPALYGVIGGAVAVLADLGVPVLVAAGWEADDILGSAAATAEGAGWGCVLATSDRDAYAQISATTSVLRLRSGIERAVEYRPERLVAELGVRPDQYVEFAALRGDVSDNLPGILGLGPTRAAALLRAYGSVAAAVTDPLGCRSVLGRTVGQALLDDVADPADSRFARNVALMTVRRDLPVDLAACRRQVPPNQIQDRLRAHGLGGIAGRLAIALAARPDWPPPPA